MCTTNDDGSAGGSEFFAEAEVGNLKDVVQLIRKRGQAHQAGRAGGGDKRVARLDRQVAADAQLTAHERGHHGAGGGLRHAARVQV
jgi:hypothetical protein